MKRLLLIFLGIMGLHLSGMCQDSLTHLNCLIKVDGKIVKTGVTDGILNLTDSNGNVLKQLSFDYDVGRIEMKKEDVILLKNKNASNAVLEFNYSQICPSVKEYKYKLAIDLDFFFQRYLIISIFNLDKKRNSRIFGDKSGYVFDVEIPSRKISAPRKIIEKDNCD